MKQRGVFLIGISFLIIYFFLFPRSGGLELTVFPLKLIDINNLSLSENNKSGTYVVTGSFGSLFIDSECVPVSAFLTGNTAASGKWIAVKGKNVIKIFKPDGEQSAEIASEGFPVSRNGSLFIYNGKTGAIDKINTENGNIQWSLQFISPLTVIDSIEGITLLGFLDGKALVIGKNGETVFTYRPGGSRVEAVYGGALSSDGKFIALISGLDPQRFILLEKRENGYRPVAHHDTGTVFRRPVSVGFVRHNKEVLYEKMANAELVNTENHKTAQLELNGSLVYWQTDTIPETVILAGKTGRTSELIMYSRDNKALFSTNVNAVITGLFSYRNLLMISTDHDIRILEFLIK